MSVINEQEAEVLRRIGHCEEGDLRDDENECFDEDDYEYEHEEEEEVEEDSEDLDEEELDLTDQIEETEEDAEEYEDINANDVVVVIGEKRKLKAPVWATAAKKIDNKAQCNICKRFLSCKKGNTSNITNHIKLKHAGSQECKDLIELEQKQAKDRKLKLQKQEKPKSGNILNYLTTKKPITKAESDKLTEAVEDFLVGTNTSFKMVENPVFRKMLFTFHSGYVAPSRIKVANDIDRKVVKKKIELKKELVEDTKVHRTVSVTTDGGTSQDLMKTKKNAVSVSRIDENWNMKTDTLDLDIADGSQTAVVIRTVVKKTLDSFGLPEVTVNMTTDDASDPRSARTPGSWSWVECQI
jgi:hypothetical protein